jgi:hypothetical protein
MTIAFASPFCSHATCKEEILLFRCQLPARQPTPSLSIYPSWSIDHGSQEEMLPIIFIMTCCRHGSFLTLGQPLWQVLAYYSRNPARHSSYILYFLVLYRQYSTRNFFLLEVMCKGSSVLVLAYYSRDPARHSTYILKSQLFGNVFSNLTVWPLYLFPFLTSCCLGNAFFNPRQWKPSIQYSIQ